MIRKTLIVSLLTILSSFSVSGENYTLKECLGIAVENNHDIKACEKTLESNGYKLRQARAAYFPQVSASLSQMRQVSPLSLVFGNSLPSIPGLSNTIDVTTYSEGLSLQQNIWDFGKTASVVKLADINKELSYLNLDKKTQEVKFNVSRGYYSLLYAKSLAKVAEYNLKEIETLFQSVKDRKREGVATNIDVLEAESEYLRFKADTGKTRHQAELAKQSFVNLLGKKFDEDFDIVEKTLPMPEDKPLGLSDFEEVKERALSSRTEFRELQLQEKMLETNINHSEWMPSLSANGSYQIQDTVFPPKQTSWSAGINLSLSLFNGFSSTSKLNSARSDRAGFDSTRKQAEQNILAQAKADYYKVLEEKDNVNVSFKRKEYLQNNYDAVSAKHREGLATLNELIEAQTKKLSAGVETQQALYNYYTSLNELEYSTGGLK